MMYMRHEAGHVFNYAYRLYTTPQWRELFGSFFRPYRDEYRPVPFSKKYVRHIEGLVRAEAPRRGLCRNLRRLAHAAQPVAAAVQGLAGHEEAPLRRAHGQDARHRGADRQDRRSGHHARRHQRDGGAVLRTGRPGAPGPHRHRARRPPGADFPAPEAKGIQTCGRYREQVHPRTGGEDHLLDRRATAGGEGADRFGLPHLRAHAAVGGGGGGAALSGGSDGAGHDACHELSHARAIRLR